MSAESSFFHSEVHNHCCTLVVNVAKVNQDIVQRFSLFLERDKVQTRMKQRICIHRVRIAAAERNYGLCSIQATMSTKHFTM